MDRGAVDASEGDAAPLASQPTLLPERRVWPLWLVLGLLALGAAAFGYFRWTAPFPLRVLIAVNVDGYWWDGSQAAASATDALGDRLSEMGFEPVRAGDPETMAILEDAADLDDAAAKLRASFIVEINAAPEVAELPIGDGFVELRIDTPVHVRHVGDDGDAEEAGRIDTWAGDSTREGAAKLLAKALAQRAAGMVIGALMGHPSVRTIVDGHDVALVNKLTPARTFATVRQRALDDATLAYDALSKKRSDGGAGALTFVSPPDADDRLVATSSAGALVTRAPVSPLFNKQQKLVRSAGLERLAWLRDDGPKLLWRGYDAFTYPATGRGAKPIVMVENLYGRARSLSVIEEGKPPRRVKVSAERKLSEARLAPSGRLVALVDKVCRGCAKEISVLDIGGAKAIEVFRLKDGDYRRIGNYSWLDDRRLMVMYQPSDADDYALWAIEVSSGKRSSLMVAQGNAVLIDPVANAAGTVVAMSHHNAGAIVTLRIADNSVESHPVGGKASALSFSPAGDKLTFELYTKRGYEIAVLDVASSKVTELTRNDAPDRFPLFSHDGKRVYFEARNTDPVFGRRRAVSRIAWVPLP